MKVLKAKPEEIEGININGFFTGHKLPKDINGAHYYPVDEFLENNPSVDISHLEQVEIEDIEKPKEPVFIKVKFVKKTKKKGDNKPEFYEKDFEIMLTEEEALFYVEKGNAVEI